MNFDVTVIGSGPGGYVAAIKAAQKGLKTCLIEKYDTLGGTCLNVGCIPSKALLDMTHKYSILKKIASDDKKIINFDNLSANFSNMFDKKEEVVLSLTKGIQYLMKKNNITIVYSEASIIDENSIETNEGIIKSKYIIISTGSKPKKLPNIDYSKYDRVINSTDLLGLKTLPKKILFVGAGVISIELGSIYNELGVDVSIVDISSRVIESLDNDLSYDIYKFLSNKGIKFYLSSSIDILSTTDTTVKINIKNIKENITSDFDYCIVSIGRTPYTKNLFKSIEILTNKTGHIVTNSYLQTNFSNIFAIGDVNNHGAMLAHKASEEAVYVVDQIAGVDTMPINYLLIPSVIYTHPEIASVGYTENELKSMGIQYSVNKFSMKGLGRAVAVDETYGFVKILYSTLSYNEILGVHISSNIAGELISIATMAMNYRSNIDDLTKIIFAHPTFSESIKEASWKDLLHN